VYGVIGVLDLFRLSGPLPGRRGVGLGGSYWPAPGDPPRFIDPAGDSIGWTVLDDCPPDALASISMALPQPRRWPVHFERCWQQLRAGAGRHARLGLLVHCLDVGGIQPPEAVASVCARRAARKPLPKDDSLLNLLHPPYSMGCSPAFEKEHHHKRDKQKPDGGRVTGGPAPVGFGKLSPLLENSVHRFWATRRTDCPHAPELVEQRRWISERRFLHASTTALFCRPGGNSQLATYMAGSCTVPGRASSGHLVPVARTVLPDLLSWLTSRFGDTALVAGLFYASRPPSQRSSCRRASHWLAALKGGVMWDHCRSGFVAISR